MTREKGGLAMTVGKWARDDSLVCHCEERSDVAILGVAVAASHAAHLPEIATPFGLAMTRKKDGLALTVGKTGAR